MVRFTAQHHVRLKGLIQQLKQQLLTCATSTCDPCVHERKPGIPEQRGSARYV